MSDYTLSCKYDDIVFSTTVLCYWLYGFTIIIINMKTYWLQCLAGFHCQRISYTDLHQLSHSMNPHYTKSQ